MRARVFDLCTCICARIFTGKKLMVNYYLINLSLKFHKDPSFGCVDIGKIKLTFCNQYFSMYFYNIYQNATFLGCSLIFFIAHALRSDHYRGYYVRIDHLNLL